MNEKKNLLQMKLYLEYYKKDITNRYSIALNNMVLDNDILNNLNKQLWITTYDKYSKLQQENKQLKEKVKQYENPDDLTLMFMYCNEKAKDLLIKQREQLQQRDEVIEKAIWHLDLFISDVNLSRYDILKILMHAKSILNKYKGDINDNR